MATLPIHHIRSGAQRPIGINRIHPLSPWKYESFKGMPTKSLVPDRCVVTTRHKDNALPQRGHIRSHIIGPAINGTRRTTC